MRSERTATRDRVTKSWKVGYRFNAFHSEWYFHRVFGPTGDNIWCVNDVMIN